MATMMLVLLFFCVMTAALPCGDPQGGEATLVRRAVGDDNLLSRSSLVWVRL